MANASPNSEKNFQKNARKVQEYLDGTRKNDAILSTHHAARRLERRFKNIELVQFKEVNGNLDLHMFRIIKK